LRSGVLFIQILSCKTNSFNELLKGWKKSKMNGFKLIKTV
jgi:hypothetical protein